MASRARPLPIGQQRLYQALRDAGVAALPRRNVPWIDTAEDGTVVLNIWHSFVTWHGNQIVAELRPRIWAGANSVGSKTHAVVTGLEAMHDRTIRVVVLEESASAKGMVQAAQCDPKYWLVEDTGSIFRLWRGRRAIRRDDPVPADPDGFGRVSPVRKERVSSVIERDPRVRRFTLDRAGSRCEIPGCKDMVDFKVLDVHHITRLGDGGADHTDNTVALCPACHARVHKGARSVQRLLSMQVKKIRNLRVRSGRFRQGRVGEPRIR